MENVSYINKLFESYKCSMEQNLLTYFGLFVYQIILAADSTFERQMQVSSTLSSQTNESFHSSACLNNHAFPSSAALFDR